jgi:hypothetical protein
MSQAMNPLEQMNKKACFFFEKAPSVRLGSRRERNARPPAAKAEGPARAGDRFCEDRPCVQRTRLARQSVFSSQKTTQNYTLLF